MQISANDVAVRTCASFNPGVEEISALIRDARDRRGWSQDELAVKAVVSRSSIQNAENPEPEKNRLMPTLKTLLKIGRALNIDDQISESYANSEDGLKELGTLPYWKELNQLDPDLQAVLGRELISQSKKRRQKGT